MSDRTCIIPLGANGQYEAVVDEEDYAFLTQWRWSYKISQWKYGQKVYARRHQRINGVRKTILMHVQILEERMGEERPSDIHTVHHINKDSLMNRRRNLEWATPSKQSKEQKKRITKAEKDALRRCLSCLTNKALPGTLMTTEAKDPMRGIPLHVRNLFDRFSREIMTRGFRKYSADAILHRIRWHMHVERGDREFKGNNNWTAPLARWFMAQNPQAAGCFETRERRQEAA